MTLSSSSIPSAARTPHGTKGNSRARSGCSSSRMKSLDMAFVNIAIIVPQKSQ